MKLNGKNMEITQEYVEKLEKALDEACTILEEESARKKSFWKKETWKEWCMCQEA